MTTNTRQDGARRRDDAIGADGTDAGPKDAAYLEILTQRFRDGRRKRGSKAAVSAWLDRPFGEWLTGLRADPGDEDALHESSVAALAVALRETLSSRDAMILSLIARDACDHASMIVFASDPHAVRSRRRFTALLSSSFESEEGPDIDRCEAGLAMLQHIADTVPDRWRAQPCAVMAYVLWWLGDGRALRYAVECLVCDDECTLGGIVLSLLERGACPAWRR
ncbi:DUF4192 family protein [Bifidobacterium sp. 82T10]|uniref:DUF4192 family protein n=1 Tax=Bifidobacterium miconis TaxID=2834435 RepID=A0ABS6WES0_9BIFI|nr:DUF4192 domain-containing protein [Bifidobacterium miconis]MBW3092245.1 DUF4192 family protein [Bifidobacterium miconis]